jgi:hypothetical protein
MKNRSGLLAAPANEQKVFFCYRRSKHHFPSLFVSDIHWKKWHRGGTNSLETEKGFMIFHHKPL